MQHIGKSVEYVKRLMDDGHEVYLCTTTDYRNVKNKFEKFIQKYYPFIQWSQVIITSKKQLVDADVLIDDGIHNLKNGGYIKILISAPHNASYNADENGMYRKKDLEEAYYFIKSMSDEDWLECFRIFTKKNTIRFHSIVEELCSYERKMKAKKSV